MTDLDEGFATARQLTEEFEAANKDKTNTSISVEGLSVSSKDNWKF